MAAGNGKTVRARDLLTALEMVAPLSGAMDFDRDNNGLSVGDPDMAVDRVLLALDATVEVVEEGAARGCQMIIAHHPLLFGGVRDILWNDRVGATVAALCRHGIGLMVAHTNFDVIREGISAALCRKLGLVPEGLLADGGCLAALPRSMSPRELRRWTGEGLGSAPWLVEGGSKVDKVALYGGAGGEYVRDAFEAGAQGLITGEVKHHEALEARMLGMTVVMAGHHATESPGISALATGLQKALDAIQYNNGMEWLISERTMDPFVWQW